MKVEHVPVLAEVQTQWQTRVVVGHPMVHLYVHPAHWGKHTTVGAMRLTGLDLKDQPKHILVGFNP